MTFPHHGEGSDTDSSNANAVQGEANEPSTDANGAGGNSDGSGPAPWASYLEDLPDSVRPLVEPKFKEWDSNVTKKIQSLHSEYDPYKTVIESYEPDYLDSAAQLYTALEADPQAFIKALTEAYGIGGEQGTTDQQEDDGNDDPAEGTYLDPRVSQHEEIIELMAQQLLQQREAEQAAAEAAQLDQALTELKSKHGEFDEDYVLTLIANGADPDAAVTQFKTVIQGYAQRLTAPNRQAPVVLGAAGGAGVPSDAVDPSTLSSKDTKKLVADLLAAANQED